MPYRIKLTDEDKMQAAKEFAEALANFKLPDGEISYKKKLGTVEGRATLLFEEKAYWKQKLLIDDNSAEVGWHGVCVRGEEPATYIVKDILVYPQEVGPATATTDQVKYQDWLFANPDEIFNNIRFQGHSHVNMATNPSTTDLNLYESLLQGLDDTMFYVFMILNKSGSQWVKIYDMRDNVVYETKDVDVRLVDDGTGIFNFLAEAREKVTKTAPATSVATTKTGTYKSYYGTGNYTGGNYTQSQGSYGSYQKYGSKGSKAQADDKPRPKKNPYYDGYDDDDGYDYYGGWYGR